MKLRSLLLAFISLLPAALFAADSAKNCGCGCCKGKAVCCCHAGDEKSATAADAPAKSEVRHPLKGVVVDILAAKSALLVKHEAIPDYMAAMTMLFKVDAATLKAAVKGQAITGTLVERDGDYWLEDMKPAAK